MTAMRSYLDHNATSPLRPEARAAMIAALDAGGNASSVHREGQLARSVVETARAQVAALVGASADMVTFTSGGTEANALALKGAGVERLVISAIEHPSVIETARAAGAEVHVAPVTAEGVLDLDRLDRVLARDKRRCLVSVMMANNETGIVQPLAQVVELARQHQALVHTDAVQGAGKTPIAWPILGVDMMSLSGHKLGAAQGVGALVARDGLTLTPLIEGGGQEKKRRAGTENICGIAGFGAAADAARVRDEAARLTVLRDRFEAGLVDLAPDAVIFGAGLERLANTSCFAVPGLTAQLLVIALDLDGVAVSSGSACSSGKVGRSHVLQAMGVAQDLAAGAIRVSLGWSTREVDIERALAALKTVIERSARRAA
ncbi:cysteine desulfurase [Rhodoligotrophos appendicifer]|uniref:cysteine desulfurase family protein n=1 Tax=Rhodoligotrophos appendicifer TaxID=987056 RepID=UPI0011872812|nr:cysteine desulfurase family protein [Rhodoligotrophos appendicifer]